MQGRFSVAAAVGWIDHRCSPLHDWIEPPNYATCNCSEAMLNEAARADFAERHHSAPNGRDEMSHPSALNGGLSDDETAKATNCGPRDLRVMPE